jgi:16S rRNA processing protein RimM
VVGAHGLQGTMKIEPLSDFPERFLPLKSVVIRLNDNVLSTSHVKRIKWAGPHLLVTLREIRTREAAEELQGAEFCVHERDSWDLPEDVYYTSDLVGFRGVAEDGTELGVLSGIISGAQDILEFAREGEPLMVPFVKEWVGRVDLAAKTIEILNWRALVETDSVDPSPDSDDH